jgi:hypothetical protein
MTLSFPAFAELQRPMEHGVCDATRLLLTRGTDAMEQAITTARANRETLSDGQSRLAALSEGIGLRDDADCGAPDSDSGWAALLARVLEWQKKFPASAEAKVAEAQYWLNYAWNARGGGFAGSVSEREWRLFRQRMQTAQAKLEAIPAQGRTEGWYHATLQVGIALKWPYPVFDSVYKEGVARYPGYLPLYFGKVQYLQPRWYGTETQLREYIAEAVAAEKSESAQILYARLQWAASQGDMFTSGRTDWARMKAGFERMIARHPDHWNLNNYAKFACMAGDWSKVLELRQRIGDHVLESAWFGNRDAAEACASRARMATSGRPGA